MSSPFRRKNTSGIIGGASPQEMVDDFEHRARENGQRLFLGAPACQQALIAFAPLRAIASSDQGSQIEGMPQSAWSTLGDAFLPGEAAAVMGARFQPRIGDDLLHAAEAGHIAQFGPDGGGILRPNARNLLQALRLVIV